MEGASCCIVSVPDQSQENSVDQEVHATAGREAGATE